MDEEESVSAFSSLDSFSELIIPKCCSACTRSREADDLRCAAGLVKVVF